MTTVDEILNAIDTFAPDVLEGFLGSLVSKIPVNSLVHMATNIAREITARNEKEAMQAAAAAIDDEMQAEQIAENELVPTGGGK